MKEVHFESEFRDVTHKRCVHNRDDEFTESLASDDVRESYFERLSYYPCDILGFLRQNQLRSFR